MGFLLDVGLDYLTLDRASATLAGGEAQRIRLATQIGSGLVGVLYVLDEPGLVLVPRHPTFALSPTGTCVARSTRVEEDGFAGGPSVGCAGGPLP